MIFVTGSVLFALPFLSIRVELLALTFPPAQVALAALVLAIMFELVWAGAVGAAFIDKPSRGIAEALAALAGATAAGLAAGLVSGLALGEFLQAQAIVAAFTLLLIGTGVLTQAVWRSWRKARAKLALTLLLFLSAPWWTQPLLALIGNAALKSVLHPVLIWLSPLALVTLPFAGFDLVTLPGMYEIMQGPVVPYPPHALVAAVGYGLVAALAFGLAYGLNEYRRPEAAVSV